MSMYETGSGLKPFLSKGETPYQEEGIPTLQPFPPHVSKTRSQLSFAISFPVPFSIPFLLFLCLFTLSSVQGTSSETSHTFHLDGSLNPSSHIRLLFTGAVWLYAVVHLRRCCYFDLF